MGASIEDIIATARLREETVTICVVEDLAARHEALVQQLQALDGWQRAKLSEDDPRRPLAEEITALERDMAEHEHVFRFQALPHKRFKTVLAAHTDENTGARNVDTLLPELVVLCCRDPQFDGLPQFERLAEKLSQGQYDRLTSAAWTANTGVADVPKSARASELIRTYGQK